MGVPVWGGRTEVFHTVIVKSTIVVDLIVDGLQFTTERKWSCVRVYEYQHLLVAEM